MVRVCRESNPKGKKEIEEGRSQSKSINNKIIDDIEEVPIEEQNVVFRPNEGPQTEFLASPRSIIWW